MKMLREVELDKISGGLSSPFTLGPAYEPTIRSKSMQPGFLLLRTYAAKPCKNHFP